MKLIHQSPLGDLDIPDVGVIAPFEPFEVDDEHGAVLLEQADLYAEAPGDKLTVPDLRTLAAERGVDLTGIRKRAEIEAAIEAAATTNTEGDQL